MLFVVKFELFMKPSKINITGGTLKNTSGYTEGYNSQDGLNIFYRRYKADPEKAVMVIAHGLGNIPEDM